MGHKKRHKDGSSSGSSGSSSEDEREKKRSKKSKKSKKSKHKKERRNDAGGKVLEVGNLSDRFDVAPADHHVLITITTS